MLNAIAPGAVSSALNPILDFWTQASVTSGDFTYYAPAAPFLLAFQIWDCRNVDEPVQIFPDGAGGKQVVDPVTARVGGIVGHYAAAWTCDRTSAQKGRYQIRWFYTPASGSPEQVSLRDFDVLPAANGVAEAGTGYALVSDLRDECVQASTASDARLLRQLALASRYIDRITGRGFSPVYKAVEVDGGRSAALMFGEPLIALVGATYGNDSVDIDRRSFRVYNRHLIQNLSDPDDRDDPRIMFWGDGTWSPYGGSVVSLQGRAYGYGDTVFGGPWSFGPGGSQRVTVRGLWGYTEYDGSPVGRTPLLIAHAAKLIAMREIPQLGSTEREDARMRARLTGERTRDQSYTIAQAMETPFTGDREIDDILMTYRRPPRLGSA